MSETATETLPEVKEIIGAILFAATDPVTLKQLHGVFRRTAAAAEEGDMVREFGDISYADVKAAFTELCVDFEAAHSGMHIVETANGFRLQNDKRCGAWMRTYLEKGKVSRLSKPALETLAIIAYRQPCTRSDVEAVRGVSVDSMVRNLLELELIKVVGRSELPGRPWLFGTTPKFMDHFGLKEIEELPGMQELKRKPIPETKPSAEEEDEEAEHAEDSSARDQAAEVDQPKELETEVSAEEISRTSEANEAPGAENEVEAKMEEKHE